MRSLLLLFFLFSCGQHQEPLYQDLRDFDGDQRLNYEEFGNDKFFANVEAPGEVNGVLRFQAGQLQEIPFSNAVDKKALITHLLVANEEYLDETPFFSEWTYLRLKLNNQITLKAKQYLVHLSFTASSEHLDEVAIVSGKRREILGSWSPFMKIELSSEALGDLISGKKILMVRKKMKKSPLFESETEETIKEKTVRLYFYDGKSPRISYISRGLAMTEIKEVFSISESYFLEEKGLIFNLPSDEVRWFHRELRNGDKILVKSSEKELKKELLKGFEYKKKVVTRENGYQGAVSALMNKMGAKIYLRVSEFVRIDRKFKDRIETKFYGRYGSARQGDWSPGYNCDHYLREIAEQTATAPDKEDLLEHFTLSPFIAGESLLQTKGLEEKYGEKGTYWETGLVAQEEHLIASIDSLPLYTFDFTGEFKNSCRDELLPKGRFASIPTHPEGKLSLVLESFVEKIP